MVNEWQNLNTALPLEPRYPTLCGGNWSRVHRERRGRLPCDSVLPYFLSSLPRSHPKGAQGPYHCPKLLAA